MILIATYFDRRPGPRSLPGRPAHERIRPGTTLVIPPPAARAPPRTSRQRSSHAVSPCSTPRDGRTAQYRCRRFTLIRRRTGRGRRRRLTTARCLRRSDHPRGCPRCRPVCETVNNGVVSPRRSAYPPPSNSGPRSGSGAYRHSPRQFGTAATRCAARRGSVGVRH